MKVSHNTKKSLFEQSLGSFTSRRVVNTEELRDMRGLRFIVLISEKTRDSNHYVALISKAITLSTQFKDPDLPHGSPILNQLSQPVGGCEYVTCMTCFFFPFFAQLALYL